MSGQIQIERLDQESLYWQFYEEGLKQADNYFLFEKFRVGQGMDKTKAMHSSLYKNMLLNDNCEIVKFIGKQLIGGLADENIDVVDLKTMQTKYRDINNYYYTQPFEWTESTW